MLVPNAVRIDNDTFIAFEHYSVDTADASTIISVHNYGICVLLLVFFYSFRCLLVFFRLFACSQFEHLKPSFLLLLLLLLLCALFSAVSFVCSSLYCYHFHFNKKSEHNKSIETIINMVMIAIFTLARSRIVSLVLNVKR